MKQFIVIISSVLVFTNTGCQEVGKTPIIEYEENGIQILKSEDGKYGISSKDKSFNIPCIYDQIIGYNLLVDGISNPIGEEAPPPILDFDNTVNYLCVKKGNKYGWIKKNGKEFIPIIYEGFRHLYKDSVVAMKKDRKWGIVDQFKTIIPFEYDDISIINDSSILVSKNNLKGIVNWNNKVKVPLLYKEIHTVNFDSTKQLFEVIIDSLYGIIDDKGSIIIPLEYSNRFHAEKPHLPFVAKKKNRFGIIDINNSIVQPFIYNDINRVWHYNEGDGSSQMMEKSPFILEKNGKYGFLDYKGKLLMSPIYQKIGGNERLEYAMDGFEQDGVIVKQNNKWKVVDILNNGKVIKSSWKWELIEEMLEEEKQDKLEVEQLQIIARVKQKLSIEYDEYILEYSHLIWVRKDTLWGIYDTTGIEIKPVKYERLEKDGNGNIKAKLNGKWGVMDTESQTLIPFIYERLKKIKYGNIKAKRNNKWGVIDVKNNILIPFIYDHIKRVGEDFKVTIGKETEIIIVK